MNISEKIRMIRSELGLTQAEFGAPLKIGNKQVSAIELGACEPSDRVLALLFGNYPVNKVWWETGVGDILHKKAPANPVRDKLLEIFDSADIVTQSKILTIVDEAIKATPEPKRANGHPA